MAGFRKWGVDAAISIDAQQLIDDGYPAFRSAAWAFLLPYTVEVDYIQWVQVLPQGLTMHRRPDPKEAALMDNKA